MYPCSFNAGVRDDDPMTSIPPRRAQCQGHNDAWSLCTITLKMINNRDDLDSFMRLALNTSHCFIDFRHEQSIMGGGRNTPTSSAYPQLAPKPVGKLIQSIYTDRLRQFLDQGQYGQQSLLAKQYHNETNEDKYIKVG